MRLRIQNGSGWLASFYVLFFGQTRTLGFRGKRIITNFPFRLKQFAKTVHDHTLGIKITHENYEMYFGNLKEAPK